MAVSQRAAPNSRASSKACSRHIRPPKSAWRRTRCTPKRWVAAENWAMRATCAREAAARHQAGLRQARQGARRCPQEGLRAGAPARNRKPPARFRKKVASSKPSARSRCRRKTRRKRSVTSRRRSSSIRITSVRISGAGVAQYRAGNKAKAGRAARTRARKPLPTAPAAYYLGELAKGRGRHAEGHTVLPGRRRAYRVRSVRPRLASWFAWICRKPG